MVSIMSLKKYVGCVSLLSCALFLGCQTTPVSASKKESFKGRIVQPNLTSKDIRGGSTQGADVTIDNGPNEAFEKIKKAKTKKEKDRQAILAQVGDYKVNFEFVETVLFDNSKKLDTPYYSWATEYIFPLEVREDFISLQHLLVMTMVDKDGKKTEPHVVKHWRQDWIYQSPDILEFVGHNTWKKRTLKPSETQGAWTQAVYQVDDSPRYQAIGKWSHNNDFSTWESNLSPRPLPRREHTHRSDYDVLDSRNRVTVTPKGWFHEQDSMKRVVDPKTFETQKYISREMGLNTYERIKDYDFSKGKEYWAATEDYWKEIRAHWADLIKKSKTISLATEVEGKKLYEQHFGFANELVKNSVQNIKSEGEKNKNEYKSHAVKTIDSFIK